jgi:Protein of unknown function (Porph_ging).
MKSRYLLLVFIFIGSYSHAQYFNFVSHYENLNKYKTIDSAYLKCSYKLVYLKDSLKSSEKSTDLQILLVGKNISKYYSQYALDYNYFVVDYLKKGHEAYPGIKEKGAWSYEVFKNYPHNKETVTDIASILRGNFVYEEDLPVFNWKISNEMQTILSYTCRKATVSFRGRDFIAWFTPDIPVPNGPWKFDGLPGLILKLSDVDNNFIYECQGLEQLKQKEPIKFYQINYTKINRKDLAKIYQRFHDNMVAYMETLGIKVNVAGGSKTLKIPYNPIELE